MGNKETLKPDETQRGSKFHAKELWRVPCLHEWGHLRLMCMSVTQVEPHATEVVFGDAGATVAVLSPAVISALFTPGLWQSRGDILTYCTCQPPPSSPLRHPSFIMLA